MIAKPLPESPGEGAAGALAGVQRMWIVECCTCGYEPEEQVVMPRGRCPKYRGFSWRRTPTPRAPLERADRWQTVPVRGDKLAQAFSADVLGDSPLRGIPLIGPPGAGCSSGFHADSKTRQVILDLNRMARNGEYEPAQYRDRSCDTAAAPDGVP